MTSFINLLANDVWTDADIVRRMEAKIRSEFSADEETILNRKVLGALAGAYTMTEDDMADQARFAALTLAVQAEGVAARADMELLKAAMACEQDASLLETASDEVRALVALRAPAPAPEPEPEAVPEPEPVEPVPVEEPVPEELPAEEPSQESQP